ncbi:hypothetical protein IOC61_14990 [Halomonas sp. KAO]|uniref:hypothetical protein n=1 Tax=unclassified Halomonas TaxID=2609666 RepID=UPI0018A082F3|nr:MULTISPECIES: hypothetical protein [unclassified Halomonas]MBF7054610.1 hypothetical protein [Halomonas sp. KAO]MDT0500021.1 hypothetical protein [Halomonas sp. PAR7]MDT0512425.1 hypothetical protein [Halomonas sp. LES1]MDT0591059.1 hypothetical protein [Halomonas sp. PAR8]
MIKALFWCFLVLLFQLGLLHYVDRRVLGMTFGGDEAGGEKTVSTDGEPQASLADE